MNVRAAGKPFRFRSIAALAVVIATVFAVASSASADEARTTTPPPRLWSFGSAYDVDSPQAVLARFIANRDTYCPGGKPIAVTTSLAQALASARQYVITQAGASAVSAFDRSAAARSATESRAAAVMAFADRKPLPALLALLRTHQLLPKDPSILASISAVLNVLGLAKQSFAVAKAADAMATVPHSVMGISGQAILLNNEGHAMLLLRQWAAAEKVLRQAVALAPELSEAKVNLALALLCQQQDQEAVRFYRLGQYRRAYTMVQEGSDPSAPSVPVTDQVFDLSQGVNASYPSLTIPTSWQGNNTIAASDQWEALNEQAVQNSFARAAHTEQLRQQVPFGSFSLLETYRYLSIKAAIDNSTKQPTLAALRNTWVAAGPTLDAFYQSYSNKVATLSNARNTWPQCVFPTGSQQACDARWTSECTQLNDSSQAAWLPLMHAYDRALRKYESARYRYESAVVANVAEPHLHDYLAAYQQQGWWLDYPSEILYERAWAIKLWGSNCHPEAPLEPNPQTDDGSNDNPKNCSQVLAGVKFAVKLGDYIKVSANCEQVGLEVAATGSIPWLGGFAEGSINFVKGTSTIFAGAKEAVKLPGTGIGVSAKEGVYLTLGGDGLEDVGLRVSTTGAFGLAAGPTVEMKGPQFQISFVSRTITF
jgi:hypothetical protein